MKKILNDLKLKFEAALWALDPELALYRYRIRAACGVV